jgi:hypothetical protein
LKIHNFFWPSSSLKPRDRRSILTNNQKLREQPIQRKKSHQNWMKNKKIFMYIPSKYAKIQNLCPFYTPFRNFDKKNPTHIKIG